MDAVPAPLPKALYVHMKNWGKLTTIIILLFIQMLMIIGIINHHSSMGVELIFKNNSIQQIHSLVIHLNGVQCGARKLAPHGEMNCHFANVGDSSYDVYITFQDKTELTEKNMGYVTHGRSYIDTITLTKNKEIKLESTIEKDI